MAHLAERAAAGQAGHDRRLPLAQLAQLAPAPARPGPRRSSGPAITRAGDYPGRADFPANVERPPETRPVIELFERNAGGGIAG